MTLLYDGQTLIYIQEIGKLDYLDNQFDFDACQSLFIFVKMASNELRGKLQNIINGTCLTGETNYCTTIRNLLIESYGTGSTIKAKFESKSIVKKTR